MSDRPDLAGRRFYMGSPEWIRRLRPRKNALAVYDAICSFAYGDSGEAHPGKARLAADVGIHERDIQKTIRELQSLGALEVTISVNSNGRMASSYQLKPPPEGYKIEPDQMTAFRALIAEIDRAGVRFKFETIYKAGENRSKPVAKCVGSQIPKQLHSQLVTAISGLPWCIVREELERPEIERSRRQRGDRLKAASVLGREVREGLSMPAQREKVVFLNAKTSAAKSAKSLS